MQGKIKAITDGIWQYEIASSFVGNGTDYEMIKQDILIFAEQLEQYLIENNVKVGKGKYSCNMRYIVKEIT